MEDVKLISLRVEQELVTKFQAAVAEDGKTMSQVLRKAMSDYQPGTLRENIQDDIWNILTDYEEEVITLDQAVELLTEYTERRANEETGILYPRNMATE